jgi:hypothetical protein
LSLVTPNTKCDDAVDLSTMLKAANLMQQVEHYEDYTVW